MDPNQTNPNPTGTPVADPNAVPGAPVGEVTPVVTPGTPTEPTPVEPTVPTMPGEGGTPTPTETPSDGTQNPNNGGQVPPTPVGM